MKKRIILESSRNCENGPLKVMLNIIIKTLKVMLNIIIKTLKVMLNIIIKTLKVMKISK